MPKEKKPYVDFRAIRERLAMEQILEHYRVLDTFSGLSGDRLTGPCPIHKGTNKTQFRVDTKKNLWNCFSECKHGGNTLDFIARMENCSVHEAALKACEWFDIPIAEVKSGGAKDEPDEPEEAPARPVKAQSKPAAKSTAAPKPEDNTPNAPLKFSLDKLEQEHPYLTNERGLTPQTIAEFGLGYCGKGMMAGRIAIPIRSAKGELLGYAGRWPGEPAEDTPKYKLPPNFRKSLELFNADRAFQEPPDKPLVIVEGFFDAIKLHQNGWRKVVALMGSTMSGAQEELIRRHTSSGSHVIVMLDEDEAGKFGREDIAAHLSRFCYVKTHVFDKSGAQPEDLSAEDLQEILEGVP